jgi:hypothetical protein
MGLFDYLGGYKPTVDESGGFDVLKGDYKVRIDSLRAEKNQQGEFDRYKIQVTIVEVIKGNGNTGRKLWATWYKDNDASMKKMANQLFTAGIDLDMSGDAATFDQKFENSFENAIGKEATIQAYGWTPDKDMQGNPIAEADRVERQQWVFRGVKKGAKKTAKSSAPF